MKDTSNALGTVLFRTGALIGAAAFLIFAYEKLSSIIDVAQSAQYMMR